MGVMDFVKKYASPALDLYNLWDTVKGGREDRQNISASDPWLAANTEGARQYKDILSDGGAAYMQTPGAQNSLDIGNTAYYRSQAGGGDRLSTGAAERRESQSLTLKDQIVNAQLARLRGVPSNQATTGRDLNESREQTSFDTVYSLETAMESLGGIFGGGSGDSAWDNLNSNFDYGSIDGWFE